MKRVNRRTFLQWLSPPAQPPAEQASAPEVAPPEAAPPAAASGFSLEAFYAARGPQKLPPIAIRPSVLHYSSELTSVGCPPPHQPPALDGDPVYSRLAADASCAPAGASPERGRR